MGNALSDLHFIQITGKLPFKTEPLLLAKTLGFLSPDSYPKWLVSSPNSPGRPGASAAALPHRDPPCTLMHTSGWS